jgi:hypothetical protein
VTLVLAKRVTDELPMLAAHTAEAGAELPREVGRPLDVREQERHRGGRCRSGPRPTRDIDAQFRGESHRRNFL